MNEIFKDKTTGLVILNQAVTDFIKHNREIIEFPVVIITRKMDSYYIQKSLGGSGGGFDVRNCAADGISTPSAASGETIAIINREALMKSGALNQLSEFGFKTVIIDGVDIIQNFKSKTYRCMYTFFCGEEKLIVLSNIITGSEFCLDPVKTFSVLKFIRAKFLKNNTWHDFSETFCNKRKIGWRSIVDGFDSRKMRRLRYEMSPYISGGHDAG